MTHTQSKPTRRRALTRLIAASAVLAATASDAAILLSEDFEDGALDPRMSITTVGPFSSAPGIKNIASLGSTKAFGFGVSTCPANCFNAHVTTMTIDLGSPTFVTTLSFKEMELFNNWGSGGGVLVDGVQLADGTNDFGRPPYNDLVADTTFRVRNFDLNRTASTIQLRVWDITRLSEIAIDDLSVSVSSTPSPVSEPASFALAFAGLALVGLGRRAMSPTAASSR